MVKLDQANHKLDETKAFSGISGKSSCLDSSLDKHVQCNFQKDSCFPCESNPFTFNLKDSFKRLQKVPF